MEKREDSAGRGSPGASRISASSVQTEGSTTWPSLKPRRGILFTITAKRKKTTSRRWPSRSTGRPSLRRVRSVRVCCRTTIWILGDPEIRTERKLRAQVVRRVGWRWSAGGSCGIILFCPCRRPQGRVRPTTRPARHTRAPAGTTSALAARGATKRTPPSLNPAMEVKVTFTNVKPRSTVPSSRVLPTCMCLATLVIQWVKARPATKGRWPAKVIVKWITTTTGSMWIKGLGVPEPVTPARITARRTTPGSRGGRWARTGATSPGGEYQNWRRSWPSLPPHTKRWVLDQVRYGATQSTTGYIVYVNITMSQCSELWGFNCSSIYI